MNRDFTEKIKIPESIGFWKFDNWWQDFLNHLDNKSIINEIIPDQALNTTEREEVIIASLTSYPARISFVHLAIKSIFLQTYKPDRVILWLAESQFPGRIIPEEITNLLKYGLEINWMHDLYGHKKYYYPVLNQKTNEVVITFDDDIIYSRHTIERLMDTHKKNPGCLVCERGQIYVDNEANPGRWKTISDKGYLAPTYSMNPSPGSGCLIPYGAFHLDSLNEKLIRELAFKNDDLWYMFMCAANGTKMVKTRKYHKIFSIIEGTQNEKMASYNVSGDMNVAIMDRLIKHYPVAWKRIVTDQEII